MVDSMHDVNFTCNLNVVDEINCVISTSFQCRKATLIEFAFSIFLIVNSTFWFNVRNSTLLRGLAIALFCQLNEFLSARDFNSAQLLHA